MHGASWTASQDRARSARRVCVWRAKSSYQDQANTADLTTVLRISHYGFWRACGVGTWDGGRNAHHKIHARSAYCTLVGGGGLWCWSHAPCMHACMAPCPRPPEASALPGSLAGGHARLWASEDVRGQPAPPGTNPHVTVRPAICTRRAAVTLLVVVDDGCSCCPPTLSLSTHPPTPTYMRERERGVHGDVHVALRETERDWVQCLFLHVQCATCSRCSEADGVRVA